MTLPAFSPTGIRFERIEKRYGGICALRRVTLDIASGECIALTGRNGSGKTTLLRIAARLVRPSAGNVRFLNEGGDGRAFSTGFVAHATMVYDELTAEENLLLFARLQGIADLASRIDMLLREVGLIERRNSLVRNFSRGMRQRVAIARATASGRASNWAGPARCVVVGGDNSAHERGRPHHRDEPARRIRDLCHRDAGRPIGSRLGRGRYPGGRESEIDPHPSRSLNGHAL